jgi:hypothetical protein
VIVPLVDPLLLAIPLKISQLLNIPDKFVTVEGISSGTETKRLAPTNAFERETKVGVEVADKPQVAELLVETEITLSALVVIANEVAPIVTSDIVIV